eukprot:Amastigsp_a1894_129.p4 type:complete len:181 gc:universal Amastigsp_a1894_129:1-543(+)
MAIFWLAAFHLKMTSSLDLASSSSSWTTASKISVPWALSERTNSMARGSSASSTNSVPSPMTRDCMSAPRRSGAETRTGARASKQSSKHVYTFVASSASAPQGRHRSQTAATISGASGCSGLCTKSLMSADAALSRACRSSSPNVSGSIGNAAAARSASNATWIIGAITVGWWTAIWPIV